jgi:hypothetical protein
VVAALGRYDNSAVAAIVGNRDNPRRQTGKAIGFQTHPAERVVFVGVESGRDQDQLWAERSQDRPRDRSVNPLVVSIGRARRKRKVDGEPGADACPDLACGAGPG